jgi:hypothetical protein
LPQKIVVEGKRIDLFLDRKPFEMLDERRRLLADRADSRDVSYKL